MTPLEYIGPNAEQIQYWNETSGPKWVAFRGLIDAQLLPLGQRAMARAQVPGPWFPGPGTRDQKPSV
jgi:hypothetical protein